MLILVQWLNEKGGALVRTTDGRIIFKTIQDLEFGYINCIHSSPKGEQYDVEVFVNRIYVDD